jgi:hypothetical protein
MSSFFIGAGLGFVAGASVILINQLLSAPPTSTEQVMLAELYEERESYLKKLKKISEEPEDKKHFDFYIKRLGEINKLIDTYTHKTLSN